MNKKSIFIVFMFLYFLLGYTSITKKEDLLFQARQIKASISKKPRKIIVSELSIFPDQEKFVYKAKFLGFSIGKFIIMNNGKMMLNGREVYCFELKVKTLPFFSKIFRTKDRYVSYMDAQEFVVLRHEEYVKGGAILESAVDFNYKNFTATYQNFINRQEHTVSIPDKLLDVLSGGFYVRMMDLELGDTVDLNIYADEKIYNYFGLVSSRTKVNVPNFGKQDAYYFLPYLFLDGEQVKKISADVFFSTTTPTQALRATLKTRFGKVNVVLDEGFKDAFDQQSSKDVN